MMRLKSNKGLVFYPFFFVAFIVGCSQEFDEEFGAGKVVFSEQGLTINVEIAKTLEQRSRGLMQRKFLAENDGMLFVFEQEGIQRVWMKNTLLDLDIVFVSRQGRVVSLVKGLKPCVQSNCKIYQSTENATYMLEVNEGVIDEQKISLGQKVLFY